MKEAILARKKSADYAKQTGYSNVTIAMFAPFTDEDVLNTDFHLINFRQNFPLNFFLSFRLNYACLIFCTQDTDIIDIYDALIVVSYALFFYIGGTVCRINMLTKY